MRLALPNTGVLPRDLIGAGSASQSPLREEQHSLFGAMVRRGGIECGDVPGRGQRRLRPSATLFHSLSVLFCVASLALSLTSFPARGGELSDLIMAPGVLAALPPGEVLTYAGARHPGTAEADAPVFEIKLQATAQNRLQLTRIEAQTARPIAAFPAQGANPVLLYFLETLVRGLAEASGGSPFYLKNRLLEALVTADLPAPAADGRIRAQLLPFANDPNQARLGDLAGLTVTLVFDPAAPGRLVSLKADTALGASGYSETLTLRSEAE